LRTKRALHARLAPEPVVADLLRCKSHVVARISIAIHADLSAAYPSETVPRAPIDALVDAGVRAFIARLVGQARGAPGAEELFFEAGRSVGRAGYTLARSSAVLDVYSREMWSEVYRVSVAQRLSTPTICRMVDALFGQVGEMHEQVQQGFRLGAHDFEHDYQLARERLTHAMLDGAKPDEIARLAKYAQWYPSHDVLVILVRAAHDFWGELLAAGGSETLKAINANGDAMVICDARDREHMLSQIAKISSDAVLIVGIPVDVPHVVDSIRLAQRASALADRQIIEQGAVIDCAHHEVALWLHSEPVVQTRLASRLLAPLDGQTPLRRRILAETLMMRLEQRASAPSIARQLGLHPQTIRLRLRKLNALFGDKLDDPNVAFATLLALKVALAEPQE
jgi:hypothetical protein